MGLIGLCAVMGWRSRTATGSDLGWQMFKALGLTGLLGIAFRSYIDNWGHAGGAFVGSLLGLLHRWFLRQYSRPSAWGMGIVSALVIAGCAIAQVNADRREAPLRRQATSLRRQATLRAELNAREMAYRNLRAAPTLLDQKADPRLLASGLDAIAGVLDGGTTRSDFRRLRELAAVAGTRALTEAEQIEFKKRAGALSRPAPPRTQRPSPRALEGTPRILGTCAVGESGRDPPPRMRAWLVSVALPSTRVEMALQPSIGGSRMRERRHCPAGLCNVVLMATLCVVAVGVAAGSLAQVTPTAPSGGPRPPVRAGEEAELNRKKEERRRFQDHELITARPWSRIFNPGDPPRIIWRDVDDVRRMGCDGQLRVRWFDADLNEAARPARPGRWAAFIEGTAPNGTPVRRSMTFYCRPPSFLFFLFPPDYSIAFPEKTRSISPASLARAPGRDCPGAEVVALQGGER